MSVYDLYRSRMSAYGDTIKDSRKNVIVNMINSTFKDSPSYFEVAINNSAELFGVHLIDDEGFLNETNQNNRYVIMQPNDNLKTGDLIEFDNKKWLCVACELFNDIYYKGKIVKCNNTLSLFKNNTLYQIPIVVESRIRLGVDETQYIANPSSKFIARVSNTEITRLISRNDIYKIGIQNYKITDVNDIVESGLIILELEFSEESQQDYSFAISILNGNDLSIQENSTLQLNVQVKMNDQTISPTPLLLFESSNDNIASVDSDGLITTLSIIDNCVITVKLASDPEVYQNININVIEEIQENYTVSILGDNSITINNQKSYSCVFKNNGIPIEDESVFYLKADDGVSDTGLAQIISQDSAENTCIVKGVSIGYVRLFVENSDESIVSDGFRIQIRSLF